jgi:bifunctional DNase/RNase
MSNDREGIEIELMTRQVLAHERIADALEELSGSLKGLIVIDHSDGELFLKVVSR